MKFFPAGAQKLFFVAAAKNVFASADPAELAWNEEIIANYCKDVKRVSGTEPVPGRKNLIRRHLLLPCGACGRAGRNFRLNAVSMPKGFTARPQTGCGRAARNSSVMPSARTGIPSERKKRSTALCTGETGCEKNFFEKSSKTGENRLQFADRYGILVKLIRKRKHSSAGRASALQAEGHRFEPCCFHQHSAES